MPRLRTFARGHKSLCSHRGVSPNPSLLPGSFFLSVTFTRPSLYLLIDTSHFIFVASYALRCSCGRNIDSLFLFLLKASFFQSLLLLKTYSDSILSSGWHTFLWLGWLICKDLWGMAGCDDCSCSVLGTFSAFIKPWPGSVVLLRLRNTGFHSRQN